jgi:hypothetical protein
VNGTNGEFTVFDADMGSSPPVDERADLLIVAAVRLGQFY